MTNPYEKEVRNMYKVADMLLTCHANLGNEYHNKAVFFDLFLLVFSALLASFTFSPKKMAIFISAFISLFVNDATFQVIKQFITSKRLSEKSLNRLAA